MEKLISSILNGKNLKAVNKLRTADGGGVRSHILTAVDKSNQSNRYVLKLFDSPDEKAKARFVREIENVKVLKQILPTSYKSWIPNVKWQYKSGNNPYIIY